MEKYMDTDHDELVKKINEYTALSRERDLNPEETEDRQALRQEYLRRIRVNMTGQMENVVKAESDEDDSKSKENN